MPASKNICRFNLIVQGLGHQYSLIWATSTPVQHRTSPLNSQVTTIQLQVHLWLGHQAMAYNRMVFDKRAVSEHVPPINELKKFLSTEKPTCRRVYLKACTQRRQVIT